MVWCLLCYGFKGAKDAKDEVMAGPKDSLLEVNWLPSASSGKNLLNYFISDNSQHLPEQLQRLCNEGGSQLAKPPTFLCNRELQYFDWKEEKDKSGALPQASMRCRGGKICHNVARAEHASRKKCFVTLSPVSRGTKVKMYICFCI